MSDDPVRRAFDVEPVLLTVPAGAAARVVRAGRRRRRQRGAALAVVATLGSAAVAVTAGAVRSSGSRQTVLPAQTPEPSVTSSSTPRPAATPSTSPTPGPSLAPRSCRAEDIAITRSEGYGAGGAIGVILLFRNVGGSTCLLAPYPDVAAVDRDGIVLAAAEQTPDGVFGDGHAARTITLAPRGRASARVEAGGNPVGGKCTRIAGLLVTVPGSGRRTWFSLPDFACTAFLRVQPLAAGTQEAAGDEPPQQTVVLSGTRVGDVPLGTPAEQAERSLRRTLGAPVRDSFTCDEQTTTTLTWGTLTAYLFEGRLHGWELRRGASTVRFEPPYDGRPGLTVRELLRRLPDGQGFPGEGPTEGQYLVTSNRAGTTWSAPGPGSNRVEAAHVAVVGCD